MSNYNDTKRANGYSEDRPSFEQARPTAYQTDSRYSGHNPEVGPVGGNVQIVNGPNAGSFVNEVVTNEPVVRRAKILSPAMNGSR